MLAAHALNYGAVWCGLYPTPELIKMSEEILNLPDRIIPIGLIAVGYKAEDKPARDIYDENRIHYNHW
ncbi:hypothetical protein KHQ81_11300 [Mycoplasmatota bacterium]|nr:hypothetical protein KHQ81_11300 [Mycoplasmatota bacterium]